MDKHVFFQLARHNQDKQIHTCTNRSPGHKCDASTLLIMIINYGKGLVAHGDGSNYCSHSRIRPLTSSTVIHLSEGELIQLTSTCSSSARVGTGGRVNAPLEPQKQTKLEEQKQKRASDFVLQVISGERQRERTFPTAIVTPGQRVVVAAVRKGHRLRLLGARE